jgi:hypothetical protein
MFVTLGDDAGGGRTIMERTVTTAAHDFTAVHGAGTVVGIAAGGTGKVTRNFTVYSNWRIGNVEGNAQVFVRCRSGSSSFCISDLGLFSID